MNKYRNFAFGILIITLLATSCQPLEPVISTPTPHPQVESWEGMEPGWMSFSKPLTIISAIYDPQGYIWATTYNHVFRWDINTSDFEDLTPEEETLGNIRNILFRNGEIWITTNKGAALYTNNQWKVYILDDIERITNFSDTGDRLWASTTTDKDVNLYYLEEVKWQKFNHPPIEKASDHPFTSVGQDSSGSIWVTNYYDALMRLDGDDWEKYDNTGDIYRIFTQPDGSLLFNFNNLLATFDGKEFAPLYLAPPKIEFFRIFPLHNGTLSHWIQTHGTARDVFAYTIDGMDVQEITPTTFNENRPENASIYPIGKTPSGWIFGALHEEGVYLYDNQTWELFSIPFDTPVITEGVIKTSPIGFTPEGNLWTLKDGLPVLFDGEKINYPFAFKENDYSCYFYKSSNFIIDSKGNLWSFEKEYGKENTICLFKKGELHPVAYKTFFNMEDIAIAPNGNIWLALEGGFLVEIPQEKLDKNDFSELKFIRIGNDDAYFPMDQIDIEIAPNNIVWAMADNELYSFDGVEWRSHITSFYASNPEFYEIDCSGDIWVSADNTLRHFDGRHWTPYRLEYYTPYAIAFGLDGAVWFSGVQDELDKAFSTRFGGHEQEGIYKFKEGNWTFFQKDGFVPYKILAAPDGAMWFIADNKWMRYKEGE